MDDAHAADVRGRNEACDVANDSATHRYEKRVAVGTCAYKLTRNLLDGRQPLRGFAIVE